MQTIRSQIQEAGAEIIAISTDTSEELSEHLLPKGLEFPLLSDPELQAIEAYGLRHEGADPFSGGDIARPAVFLIGENGKVLWKDLTDNWRVRVRPETILEKLRSAG